MPILVEPEGSIPAMTADDVLDGDEQHLVTEVLVDWDRDGYGPPGSLDDLSDRVGSIKIDRALVGDLPEAVMTVEGHGAAQADVDLVRGDHLHERKHAAWYFSRLNGASPLAGKERLGRPMRIRVGVRVPGQTEPTWYTRFTGYTRSLPVKSSTASLVALDGRERLRRPAQLPMMLADWRDNKRLPGLNAQAIVDRILRTNGLYLTPPVRAQCVASLPLHGTAHPEVGELYSADLNVGGVRQQMRFVPGRFGLAMAPSRPGETGNATITFDRSQWQPTMNNGATLNFEGWFFHAGEAGQTGGFAMSMIGGPGVGLVLDVVGGRPYLYVQRGGATSNSVYLAPAGFFAAPGWYYWSLRLNFLDGGVAAQWRLKRPDGLVQDFSAGFAPAFGMTDDPGLTILALYNTFGWEAVQVTTESNAAPHNDGWQPHVHLDPSRNELAGVLPGEAATDGWEQLNEIAAAELATHHFEDDGFYRYLNADRWSDPAAQTAARVIRADREMLEDGYTDEIDAVRNVITVQATPLAVSGFQSVWKPAEVVSLAPFATIEIEAQFEHPVADFAPGPWWIGQTPDNQTWFRAAINGDGSGAEIRAFRVSARDVTATGMTVRITSLTSSPIWFATETGEPGINFAGRSVTTAASAQQVTVRDDESVAVYGEQPLDLGANPWRQLPLTASGVAANLVTVLRRPRPLLTDIRVVGDPRLKLGDRVHVTDADLGLDGDYWVVKIVEDISPSGYLMTLTLRQAWSIGSWGSTFAWDSSLYGWGP